MEIFFIVYTLTGLYLMWVDRDHDPSFYFRKMKMRVLRVCENGRRNVQRRMRGVMHGEAHCSVRDKHVA
ncbi:MAG: hypothetical protein ACI4AQ_05460 [Lachnospiraceae bacterium]